MVKKIGRYGAFLACSGYPDCKNTKPLDGDKEEPEVTEEKCPECGKPLVVRHGRYGAFLACSGYPNCKYIKKTEKGTGVKCPACGEGELVARRTKRGKIFYGCNRYPKCDFALWQKPTGDKCPDCGSLLIQKNKKIIACSNTGCGYSKEA